MPSPRCARCPLPACLLRPRTAERLCRGCFLDAFEAEALRALLASPTPSPGATVAVAASGGKDSSVLAHLLQRLQLRHRLNYRLVLLSVDEGIAGYREAALDAVRRSRRSLPLVILSHQQLFGWSVDDIGKNLGTGSRCTFCGVWRRQALERGARMLGVDWIATGHNADDIAETVLMNFLRGDVARLRRAATEATVATRNPAEATTNLAETIKTPPKPPKKPPELHPNLPDASSSPLATQEPEVATPWPAVPRWKPLRHAYEKDIVLYAYFEGLDYVSTECVYAPQAYRGHARTLLKDLEATRATTIAALGHSGRYLAVATEVATKTLGACRRCGFAASQPLCKACVLLASLERGLPRVGLGKRAVELATGLGGHWEGGGHEKMAGCYQGDGRQGGSSCGAGGQEAGGCQGGDHEAGGHCSCSHGAGGHQGGGHEAGGHRDDGQRAGGHRVAGPGLGSHSASRCCRGGCGRRPGEFGEEGAGGPQAGGHWASGGHEVEVEVVGRGGREGLRRLSGVGRVRGALDVWDF